MPGSFVRKIEQFMSLSEAEKQIIRTAPMRVRTVGARQDIVSDGEQLAEVSLITEGSACRYKLLGDGRRQILGFLIPGDICDVRALLLGPMDHGVGALSCCQIAVIPHKLLFEVINQHPRIAHALWASTMLDAAIYRQWLTSIGRSSAYERIAHLFCEVWYRLEAVGLTPAGSYGLPVTQTDIADATGLSPVHVNRTLQKLRADGLIT